MRTKPTGATASGEMNVRPSSATSWKNSTTSTARIATTHPVESVNGGEVFASRRVVRVWAMRSCGGRGKVQAAGRRRLDLGDHAAGQCVPVVRKSTRARRRSRAAGSCTSARVSACSIAGTSAANCRSGGDSSRSTERRRDHRQSRGEILVHLVGVDTLHVRVAGTKRNEPDIEPLHVGGQVLVGPRLRARPRPRGARGQIRGRASGGRARRPQQHQRPPAQRSAGPPRAARNRGNGRAARRSRSAAAAAPSAPAAAHADARNDRTSTPLPSRTTRPVGLLD